MELRAVSLFTNCGAGDIGFSASGFQFDILAEIDCRRLAVAALNHPYAIAVHGDLRTTWGLVRDRYRERVGSRPPDLLAACPPCQGISSARGGRGNGSDPDAGIRDGRNLLVVPIAKVAAALRPRAIVVENVTAFLTRQIRDPETRKPISAAQLLIAELTADYAPFAASVDLADYGVPQHRRRCFLTFIRRDEDAIGVMRERNVAPFPRPTYGTRNRPTISLERAFERMGLSPLDAQSDDKAIDRRRAMHRVPIWNERRYAMVAAIPKRKGNSAWENETCTRCGEIDVGDDNATCPRCGEPLLRPVVKGKNGDWRLIHGFRSSSYRRMRASVPASTITTASAHIGSDFTIHPWENRVLSPLECAELQTIPRSFDWGDTLVRFGHTFVREMIGEAVPPLFTAKHGRILRKLLDGNVDRTFLPRSDRRCARAAAALKVAVNGDEDPSR